MKELEMLFSDRNRYVQICRKNDVLKESEWLKNFIIILVLALVFFGLYFIEEYVAKNIKKDGRYAKNVISSAELKIGKEQFKKQRFIIYMCVMASAVLCLLFKVTNNIVFWILFFVSWLCFIGTIASVRPCLKKKMLNFLNEKQNLQNTGAQF